MVPARRLTGPLLFGMLAGSVFCAATPVRAAGGRVVDEANFFSPAAVENANAKIKAMARQCRVDLLIETVPAVPSNLESKLQQQGKSTFFRDWATRRAEDAGLKGIYVLICKKPGHFAVIPDHLTRQRLFIHADVGHLTDKVLPLLQERKNDEALKQMVDFVQSTLHEHLGQGGTPLVPKHNPLPSAVPERINAGSSGGMVLGLICVAIIALLAIMLIVGIFRAITGVGRGGYGPGGGSRRRRRYRSRRLRARRRIWNGRRRRRFLPVDAGGRLRRRGRQLAIRLVPGRRPQQLGLGRPDNRTPATAPDNRIGDEQGAGDFSGGEPGAAISAGDAAATAAAISAAAGATRGRRRRFRRRRRWRLRRWRRFRRRRRQFDGLTRSARPRLVSHAPFYLVPKLRLRNAFPKLQLH